MSVPARRTGAELAFAVTVGIVLADSSIVTLALPEILTRFDASVFGVSWVLSAFNLVLALAVLPAARLARGRAGRLWTGGVVCFAGASLVCAVAPSLGVLIAARVAQALGGAAVIAGAIELLARARGSHREAAARWGLAGLAGLAVGPAVGGLLTDVLSWEAIFALQVPVVVVAPLGLRAGGAPSAPAEGRSGRGWPPAAELAPELALGLLSAGLTGALFLLVVMLTEGWLLSPLAAGLIVSAMPLAMLAARPLAGRVPDHPAKLAAGAVLLGGGLVALGLLPGARFAWTLPPQLLIGAGLAFSLPGLTDRALAGADPEGRRAAGTIGARHLGVVAGIVILTPLFSAELSDQHDAAQRSGTALLLDAPLPPETKIELADEVAAEVERAGGRLPHVRAVFERVEPPEGQEEAFAELEDDLVAEVEKGATQAFSLSFLAAGALALLALVPIGLGPARTRFSLWRAAA